jgi:uncharacterized protein YndB with AHSA1/START domain
MDRTSKAERFIPAAPDAVYRAFTDPDALAEWLPPGDMSGVVRDFDLRVGGGYVMSLFYPEGGEGRGKTSSREDRVRVRFMELDPPRRIVEAGSFDAADPSLQGEMTMIIEIAPEGEGSRVEFSFVGLPSGLRPEDNDEGARLSLEQLARRFA